MKEQSPISETLNEIKNEDETSDILAYMGAAHEEKTSFEDRVKFLLRLNICELVDKPENVEVKAVKGDQTTVFEVTVDSTDLGKLIGKKGATAQAIRKMVWCWAAKSRVRAVMEIVE